MGLVSVGIFGRHMAAVGFDHLPEVDAQGYFLMGQSFAGLKWPRWADDLARFRGHVYVDVAPGQVMAKYPPGYPLLLAIGHAARVPEVPALCRVRHGPDPLDRQRRSRRRWL